METVAPLDREDLQLLRRKLGQRLKRLFLACICTSLLPYVAVLAGMLFMQIMAGQAAKEGVNIGPYIPITLEDWKLFLIMSPVAGIVAYYALGIFVVVFVVRKILPILLDLIVRKKRVLVFKPETYQLPGCADFFLQTPFKNQLFTTVTVEEYQLAEQGHLWQFQEAKYSKVELFFAPVTGAQ